jgi:hypothetical protein
MDKLISDRAAIEISTKVLDVLCYLYKLITGKVNLTCNSETLPKIDGVTSNV